MSNNCYLIVSDHGRPPVDEQTGYDSNRQVILRAPYHIPLLWPVLFESDSLRQLEKEDRIFWEACATKSRAVELLDQRAEWLSAVFAANGGLAHHVALFKEYLASVPLDYIHLETSENTYSNDNFPVSDATHLFRLLDASDSAAKEILVDWSTVMAERTFITLKQAQAGDFAVEDMQNYFRIMGDTYWTLYRAPWT